MRDKPIAIKASQESQGRTRSLPRFVGLIPRIGLSAAHSWNRVAAILVSLGLTAELRADEFRGLWVDTFHAGMRNAAEISQLVADARAGRFNAVVVEVRKRGDAYYNSRFEPKASDVASGFDPLAELLRQAHKTDAGPRLEVHAWIVTYNIWNNESTPPPQPDHPYRRHPDWLTKSFEGATWDGSNYAFDPGHPEVQEHSFQVALDLITRYDLDGFHWDYIRYAGREWGYNDVAVARFNQETASSGKPAVDDSAWLQWRRDQVTGLVRRVYLTAMTHKPRLKISAATITWTPSPTTDPQWLASAAYSTVLQDWRGWMAEGLLDLNLPMAYFRQEQNAVDWANWSKFAKEHRYGRHLVLGVGAYLNTISNTLVQMGSTRQGTDVAPKAEGVIAYSYAVTAKNSVPRSEFFSALTGPSIHHPNSTALFETPTATPPMPWKTANGDGPAGLMGYVRDARTGEPLANVTLELCDRTTPFLVTDAHGFFGLAKSPNTALSLVTSAPGYASEVRWIPLRSAEVTRVDLALEPADADLAPQDLRVSVGTNRALVSWSTRVPTAGQVIYGLGGPCGPGSGTASDGVTSTNHTVWLELRRGVSEDPALYRLRVVTWEGQRTNISNLHRFSPAGPQIQNETEARWTGAWGFVTNSSTSVAQSYRRAATVAGAPTAVLTWRTPIDTPGFYDVSVLYPPTDAGCRSSPFEIETSSGRRTVTLNQATGGGQYRTLATNIHCRAGDTAIVRLRNNAGTGSGLYVLADAVNWTFRPGQDPPPPGQIPEWWSDHYFRQQVGGAPDADEDGYSNYAEFVLGTDPLNPASRLMIRSALLDPAGWHVRFHPRHLGRTYRLLRAPQLGPPAWESVPAASLVAIDETEGEFTDPSPAGERQFYCLQVDLPP